ncbi:MAG: hypothetical protein J6S14_04465 [Clostridia bacterium]|nr:hypothetical protein [Clostridia bacterium]
MSKAKTIRQKKEARRRVLLILKAWLPVATVVLLLIAMAVPALQYTVKGAGQRDPISEWELLSNTWTTSRATVFGTKDYSIPEQGFAKACFLTVLISSILALISVGLSVWSSVGATRYFLDPKQENRERVVYRTFFNRPLLFLYQMLFLPLVAFPRVIVWYYQDMMFYPTVLDLTFPEPLMIFGALMVLWLVATLVMKKWERSMKLDPFADPHREKEEEKEEIYVPQFSNEEEKTLYEMYEKSREEQMAQIRKLFSGEDNQGTKE